LDSLFLQNVPGLTKLNLQNCEVLLLYMLHVQYNISTIYVTRSIQYFVT
jgi:hypothetical protein